MPEYENEKNIQFINERQTSTLQSVVQINLNLKIILSNEKKKSKQTKQRQQRRYKK